MIKPLLKYLYGYDPLSHAPLKFIFHIQGLEKDDQLHGLFLHSPSSHITVHSGHFHTQKLEELLHAAQKYINLPYNECSYPL